MASSSDNTGSAWKAFGGYNFNENFAVEASYVNFGNVTTKATATGDFSTDFINYAPGSLGVKIKGEASAVTLDAVGILKSKWHFDIFGKIGVYNAHSKLSVEATASDPSGSATASDSVSDSNTNIHIGAGTNIWFTSNIGMRLEWELFNKVTIDSSDTNISAYTASLVYHF